MNTEIKLYQREPNSVWYTENPIFCKETGKQIFRAFEIQLPEKDVSEGIFDWNLMYKIFMRYFIDNEIFYTRQIYSEALPIRQTRVIERGKLTPKLRYEILKRDGFKCVCCGKNASEVKLEIDHIIPISKGGLTIKSNLQTLCDKCNIGKGNNL